MDQCHKYSTQLIQTASPSALPYVHCIFYKDHVCTEITYRSFTDQFSCAWLHLGIVLFFMRPDFQQVATVHSIMSKIHTCFIRGILPFASAKLQHYRVERTLLRVVRFFQRCVMYGSCVMVYGMPFLQEYTSTTCFLERRSSLTAPSQPLHCTQHNVVERLLTCVFMPRKSLTNCQSLQKIYVCIPLF